MNEWSPGGNYSCPGTPNRKSLRFVPDESVKGTKPVTLSSRLPPESRSRNIVQHSMEDVSKGLPFSSKKTSGNSDPRFKRVVPYGVQNDACVGTEIKSVKSSRIPEERRQNSTLFMPEFKTTKAWVSHAEIHKESKSDAENFNAPGDPNFNQSHDLKEVDKLTFTNDNSICNLRSHESESECTLNTRNTSLTSEEFTQDSSNAIAVVMAPATVKKVENWIQEQTPKLEKKHSVITVIGQMQEPDVLSSALQEIDKRRKLAKELDRFAICKKIVETDKEKEMSDLLLKISSLNSNINYLIGCPDDAFNLTSRSTKLCEEKIKNTPKPSTEETLVISKDVITSSSLKESFLRKIRKCRSENKCIIKDLVLNDFQSKKAFCILIAISGILFWFAFFSLHKSAYLPFDLFNTKPKPITWYERICKWLWELFRPSKSYHRTSHWHSY